MRRKKPKLTRVKEVLIELDKGDYDNFIDKKLLSEELMRDFKISSTMAGYIAEAFLHYKDKEGSEDV